MSKGDDRRPAAITDEQLEANWRRVFGHERAGTAYDPGAAGHELAGRRRAPQLELFEWQPGIE